MKKIPLIISICLNVALIVGIAVLAMSLQKGKVIATNNQPATACTAQEITSIASAPVYVPKPIALELMNETEKAAVHLSTSTENRVQVLSRDKDGKVVDYKIIKKDSDILKEY